MMSKKVPELRFKGFTDDWEERKLGNYIIQYSEKTKQNNQYPVLTSSRNGLFFQKDYYKGNQIASEDNTGYNIVPRGYFTYRHMSDDLVFKFNINDIADYGIVSTLYPVFTTNEQLDSKYLQYQLNEGSEFKRFSLLQKQGGSRTYMYLNKLQNMILTIPKLEEQQKIGSFFKHLDDTIALYQRKLDLLIEQKKGFLQKMFPKHGEKVPELRFAGFADDWEEHKVGNFLSESKIKGSDGSVSKKLTVKLWRKGIVPKEEIYKGSSATQYYIRLAGQFMYGKLDFLNQAFGILPNELDGYESTLDSPAFDFKDGINPNFFLEYVCRENFYKYQGNIANGSRKAKRIHADTFFDMPITIPNFEEQQKIGSFFKQLDDTIALHQRKLDLLKEQKKGFLQKMFV